MNEECVVAVFDNLEHAQQAVHVLDRGEFPTEQITLAAKGLKEYPEIAGDLEMEDDSAGDAAMVAGLGAIVGVLSGIAVMVMSGPGGVFLAGPIGGGMVGAVSGGFLGGIAGWGVHHRQSRHYDKLVRQGKVLLIAHGSPLELVRADRILTETDPVELHVYAKTNSEAPEVKV